MITEKMEDILQMLRDGLGEDKLAVRRTSRRIYVKHIDLDGEAYINSKGLWCPPSWKEFEPGIALDLQASAAMWAEREEREQMYAMERTPILDRPIRTLLDAGWTIHKDGTIIMTFPEEAAEHLFIMAESTERKMREALRGHTMNESQLKALDYLMGFQSAWRTVQESRALQEQYPDTDDQG